MKDVKYFHNITRLLLFELTRNKCQYLNATSLTYKRDRSYLQMLQFTRQLSVHCCDTITPYANNGYDIIRFISSYSRIWRLRAVFERRRAYRSKPSERVKNAIILKRARENSVLRSRDNDRTFMFSDECPSVRRGLGPQTVSPKASRSAGVAASG